VQRRLRLRDAITGAAAGLLLLALSVVLAVLLGRSAGVAVMAGSAFALIATTMAAKRASQRWTAVAAALEVEVAAGGLDNLLVTATALENDSLRASDWMRVEIERQAAASAEHVAPASVAPLGHAAALLGAAAIGTAAVAWGAFTRPAVFVQPRPISAALSIGTVRATVTPPAYLGTAPHQTDNPTAVAVPEGGRVRIDVEAETAAAWLVEPGQPARALTSASAGLFALEWAPAESKAVVIAAGDRDRNASDTRVLNIAVSPDAVPRVRVISPGHDLATANVNQVVEVVIEASDQEALRELRLTWVKMSGSGESFAFAEGEAPVEVERMTPRQWRARARLSLASLKLEDGDSLVYRAAARDSNPHGQWVESESYTIDVGKRLEFASAGSAVPDEDRRYALSQQMVIVKTERLQGNRGKFPDDSWAEQTRLLAMEQRMVRAEVVFLSGGEVEDEVEEAERSSELQEGRLQNAGHAEMLRAINEMSRAEARLNAGDTQQALTFERAALAALQRAFDRRRYFLRTLGERSRIDPSRRLTGDLAKAQSSGRSTRPQSVPELDAARQLVRDLARLDETNATPDTALLGRLASVEPTSAEWRILAAELAAAVTPEARREAADRAMVRLAAFARTRAGASSSLAPATELRGWWREEWRTGGRP
jgi:hypothetical protein